MVPSDQIAPEQGLVLNGQKVYRPTFQHGNRQVQKVKGQGCRLEYKQYGE